MNIQRMLTLAALLGALTAPAFAEAPAAPAKGGDDTPAATQLDEKREGKMRDRWRKMTPEQRDEMRQKADRRLQERFDLLSQPEQEQINAIIGDMDKLSKEQRSILNAKIAQKKYRDRQKRKLMDDLKQSQKGAGDAASAPTKPAAPTAPAVPAPAAPAPEPAKPAH